ncbi:MAG: rhombosortase [Ketobacter sp.]|nr:MAG: rhombosortase [Ketobacter sp.]
MNCKHRWARSKPSDAGYDHLTGRTSMSDQIDLSQEAAARRSFNEFFRQWWFSVAVMLLICLTTLLPASTIHDLALVHDKVSDGEFWRIISSQFVHLGFNHTVLNLVGYLIVSASFREDITPTEEMTALGICALGVGMGIYLFNPEIGWYVGLSGAIYGILTHYLIIGWRRSAILSAFFGLYLIGKFVYEQLIAGPDTVTADLIGGAVAIDSHLYGAITGLVTGLISLWLFHRPAPAQQ